MKPPKIVKKVDHQEGEYNKNKKINRLKEIP
jgi:hypothetical protein